MNACVPDARTLAAVCFLVTGSLSASAAAAACASASPNALARTKSSAASARSAPNADPAAAWLVPGRAPPFASASASISVTHAAAPRQSRRARHSDRRRVSAAAANAVPGESSAKGPSSANGPTRFSRSASTSLASDAENRADACASASRRSFSPASASSAAARASRAFSAYTSSPDRPDRPETLAEGSAAEDSRSAAADATAAARARAAAVASAAADLESSAAEPSARVSGRSGRSGDEVYAEKARLARAAADEADAGEKERRDAEAQASARFSASEARLVEAERLKRVGPFAEEGPFAEDSPGTAFAAAALTRRRSLCRARRDWRGAAACVTEMLALADANGGALPGTSHAAAGSALGALRAEAAELFVRAKAFGDAEAHAAAAAEALRDPVTRKHTAASVRASGTHAFITARLGDLEGAAQMYRDARAAALAESAFGAATEASADLADLEAALGSVRFAMSEARGDELSRRRPAKGAEEGDEEGGEEPEIKKGTSSSSSEDAEAAARGAARRRRLAAVAALEEALGCFTRAADIERALGGAYSARCVELEDRADACATALAEERAEGEDGAPFL